MVNFVKYRSIRLEFSKRQSIFVSVNDFCGKLSCISTTIIILSSRDQVGNILLALGENPLKQVVLAYLCSNIQKLCLKRLSLSQRSEEQLLFWAYFRVRLLDSRQISCKYQELLRTLQRRLCMRLFALKNINQSLSVW